MSPDLARARIGRRGFVAGRRARRGLADLALERSIRELFSCPSAHHRRMVDVAVLAPYVHELRKRSSDVYNDVVQMIDYLQINPDDRPQEIVDRETDELRSRLRWYVGDFYERVRFIFELMAASKTREAFELGFAAFDGKHDELQYDEETGGLYCPALGYSLARVAMLESMIPLVEKTAEQSKLEVLENVLRNTAKIMKDHGIEPDRETVIYKAVGNVLSLYFPKLTFNVNFPKPLKNYKPDFGVPELGVAVEYKFATSEVEVKAAVDGIFTDMHAYSGTSPWRTFYAVIYMTGPYYTAEQMTAHVESSSGPKNWKILPVLGTGSKEAKKRLRRRKAAPK